MKSNVFVKPDEQNKARFNSAMARKGAMKWNSHSGFATPKHPFTPWIEKNIPRYFVFRNRFSNFVTTMSFTTTILQWYQKNGRMLPWRQTRDPYAIWLSEIILQQTRIEQGQPYWQRFIERWPTVDHLAQASEDEVLRLWQGLGYYSRARHLLQAARQVVAMGGFPKDMKALRSLKGVGDYTAAAIGSIAFDLPVAVVDGNVYRVLSRYYGITTPINSTAGKHEFAALAQQLLPEHQAADYNQAMMDFGALQCTPKGQQCQRCPLQETCVACREGRVDTLPVKLKTVKVSERLITYIYIRCNGQTAIRRRPEGDIWQGLWEPPMISPDALPAEGGHLTLVCSKLRHVLTHRVILADCWLWETATRPPLSDDYIWIDESAIDHYAVSRLVEMMLQKIHTNND